MIVYPKDHTSEEGKKKVDIMKLIARAKGLDVESTEKNLSGYDINFSDGSPFFLAASFILDIFDVNYKKRPKFKPEQKSEFEDENLEEMSINPDTEKEEMVRSLFSLCDTCKNDFSECEDKEKTFAKDVVPDLGEKDAKKIVKCDYYEEKPKRGRKKNGK